MTTTTVPLTLACPVGGCRWSAPSLADALDGDDIAALLVAMRDDEARVYEHLEEHAKGPQR